MGASHAHSHSENAESPRQQAAATNPDALPAGFPCSLQTDLLKWNDQVVQKDQFGKWKLILLNAEKFHAGNVAILKRGKDVVLIDSGCAKNYEKLVKKITKRDYAPFFLVNTHAHPDHTGANVEMVEEGAIVLAHRNAREHMVGYGVPGESGLPVVTFGRSMSIYAGDQRMRLIGLAPGHTDGDLAVWVPGLNILHTGDIFMSSDYPLIDSNSGGTIAGLIRSINRMIRLSDQDTVVIPGHGDLAGHKQLVQYQEMLVSVSEDVRKQKELGLDVEAVKDLNLTKKYDKKWGNGDLISGRQFVGFVYNTLPEKTLASSRRSFSNRDLKRHRAEDSGSSSFCLFSKEATLEIDKRGKALLRFDADNRDNDFYPTENDTLTGRASPEQLSVRSFDPECDADPLASIDVVLNNSSGVKSSVRLVGRLQGVSSNQKVTEMEFIFDDDNPGSDRFSDLVSNGVMELESVQIDQMDSCSVGDI